MVHEGLTLACAEIRLSEFVPERDGTGSADMLPPAILLLMHSRRSVKLCDRPGRRSRPSRRGLQNFLDENIGWILYSASANQALVV